MPERDSEISFGDYVVSNTHSRLKPESFQLDDTIPLERDNEVVESNTEIPDEVEINAEPSSFAKRMEGKSQHSTFDGNLSVSDFERVKPFHSTTSNAKLSKAFIPTTIRLGAEPIFISTSIVSASRKRENSWRFPIVSPARS